MTKKDEQNKSESYGLNDEQAEYLVDQFYSKIQEEVFSKLFGDHSEQIVENMLGFVVDKLLDKVGPKPEQQNFESALAKVLEENGKAMTDDLIFEYIDTLSSCGSCENCEKKNSCCDDDEGNKLN